MWDVKEMDAPRDTCLLTDGAKNAKTLGAVSLEWMQEAGPTKYLVGTEMGMILSCQNKPKKPCEVFPIGLVAAGVILVAFQFCYLLPTLYTLVVCTKLLV